MKLILKGKVEAYISDPEQLADVLNAMGMYLEGHEPPPNHWEPKKRAQTYIEVAERLSPKTKEMILKLSEVT